MRSSISKASGRPSKSSHIVVLRLSSDVLSGFLDDKSQPATAVDPTPAQTPAPTPSQNNDTKSEKDDTTANTPQPVDAADGLTKTTTASLKAGVKRPSSANDAKAGPKKKARLTDGPNDRSTPTAKRPGAAATGTAKGPRGNTGAINAGLRALDRSGKPCRKWGKRGFHLKSFTGVQWALGSWSAPTADLDSFPGDVKSDASSSAGMDVAVQTQSASRASDSSNTGDNTVVPGDITNGMASSPAPIPA